MNSEQAKSRLDEYRERFEGSSSKEGFIETASIKKRNAVKADPRDTANAAKRLMETGALAVSDNQ